MIKTLSNIKVKVSKLVSILCDNTNAINISKNLAMHSRTKNIDIQYHFLREHVLNNDVTLEYVAIADQLADIFTKSL